MEALLNEISSIKAAGAGRTPIYTFKPARFKAFVEIFKPLVKLYGSSPIRIENARLAQPIGHENFLVEMDLTNILVGEQVSQDDAANTAVSFDFTASKEHLKELSAITGNAAVKVYDQGDEILFTNGHMEARLLKAFSPAPCLPAPVLPDAQPFGEMVQDIELRDLKAYCARRSFVWLLCYGEQIEQIMVSGKRPYTLRPSSRQSLEGCQPDHVFTSQNFLKLAGQLDLSVGICKNDQGCWLKTSSRPSMVNALTTYELLYHGKI